MAARAVPSSGVWCWKEGGFYHVLDICHLDRRVCLAQTSRAAWASGRALGRSTSGMGVAADTERS